MLENLRETVGFEAPRTLRGEGLNILQAMLEESSTFNKLHLKRREPALVASGQSGLTPPFPQFVQVDRVALAKRKCLP